MCRTCCNSQNGWLQVLERVGNGATRLTSLSLLGIDTPFDVRALAAMQLLTALTELRTLQLGQRVSDRPVLVPSHRSGSQEESPSRVLTLLGSDAAHRGVLDGLVGVGGIRCLRHSPVWRFRMGSCR